MATIAIGVSPDKGGASTARVPIDMLSEDGVPPEEGDKIQASIEGTVQSVTGGTATISIDSVNGEPIGEQGEEASESPEEENQEEGAGPPPGAGGGPSGPASGADGLGVAGGFGRPLPPSRPLSAKRPIGSSIMPTGETLGQMGKRLKKASRGKPLPF